MAYRASQSCTDVMEHIQNADEDVDISYRIVLLRCYLAEQYL